MVTTVSNLKPNTGTHPSDTELRLGREAVLAVKMGYADEVRIFQGDDGDVRYYEVEHGQTRIASDP